MLDSNAGSLRDIFIVLMILFPVLGLINLLWGARQLKIFIDLTSEIETGHHMQKFKSLVSTQMYCALFQIAFLGLPLAILLIGYLIGTLRSMDFLYVLVPSIVILLVGASIKSMETKVKEMPVRDEFKNEFDGVVHIWMHKPLPNW